ncbi:hypothetical protein [Neobacillus massiliamazoniensis]|uniref:Group-specific protein n=1 Tax=Neobacillus massiliamazoniensis TaxID=1499688 RepID=A0A0U1NRY9_9BACI|nr:hypothetical protein [Neobacillus massiliamazoniensis]CRK80819.1 group-specific protein [Neobacillus massiliamazoniensis]
MQEINIKEKNVEVALFQFILPFSFYHESEQHIFHFLQKHHFKHFQLDHEEDENSYYGQYHVSHRCMRDFYLPFTKTILFPDSEYEKGIQRYSKPLNIKGNFTTDHIHIPFQIHSIDITLCPFELGFLTIRTEVNNTSLSDAIEFAARFRVIEPRNKQDLHTQIEWEGKIEKKIKHFIFDTLFYGLEDFFGMKNLENTYFETFPFFEDARMYVQSLISLEENMTIDSVDVYRSISLSGLTPDGSPYVSANNLPYIDNYLMEHGFHRWAPHTFFTMEEHSFGCLTNQNKSVVSQLASKVYGEYYYGLLLNLFHKIVLLKVTHSFAKLYLEQDTKKMEKLIYSINSFTANYYFTEIASQSQGREIYNILRTTFNIELLYKDAKQTLYSLFKYQENANSKKDSLLLLILTLYSVIGQMFGMSFVISDFDGKIKWSHIMTYNPVEYFALFVLISGVCVSVFLGLQNVYQWIRDIKNRDAWVQFTVLSSIKKKDNHNGKEKGSKRPKSE